MTTEREQLLRTAGIDLDQMGEEDLRRLADADDATIRRIIAAQEPPGCYRGWRRSR